MLNTTNIKMGSSSSNVTFNQPSSGMMQRSHPKSFFVRFSKKSKMEDWLFNADGQQACLKKHEYSDHYKKLFDVEVLQVLVFGDIDYLCELVKTDDLIEPTQ